MERWGENRTSVLGGVDEPASGSALGVFHAWRGEGVDLEGGVDGGGRGDGAQCDDALGRGGGVSDVGLHRA